MLLGKAEAAGKEKTKSQHQYEKNVVTPQLLFIVCCLLVPTSRCPTVCRSILQYTVRRKVWRNEPSKIRIHNAASRAAVQGEAASPGRRVQSAVVEYGGGWRWLQYSMHSTNGTARLHGIVWFQPPLGQRQYQKNQWKTIVRQNTTQSTEYKAQRKKHVLIHVLIASL